MCSPNVHYHIQSLPVTYAQWHYSACKFQAGWPRLKIHTQNDNKHDFLPNIRIKIFNSVSNRHFYRPPYIQYGHLWLRNKLSAFSWNALLAVEMMNISHRWKGIGVPTQSQPNAASLTHYAWKFSQFKGTCPFV